MPCSGVHLHASVWGYITSSTRASVVLQGAFLLALGSEQVPLLFIQGLAWTHIQPQAGLRAALTITLVRATPPHCFSEIPSVLIHFGPHEHYYQGIEKESGSDRCEGALRSSGAAIRPPVTVHEGACKATVFRKSHCRINIFLPPLPNTAFPILCSNLNRFLSISGFLLPSVAAFTPY